MTTPPNIFEILAIPRREEPHDRVLKWLCDPDGGHGVPDFAIRIVRSLWPVVSADTVTAVKRQYKLADDSWPDLGVKMNDGGLLVLENKVNAGALREGQLERQHELGLSQQRDKPFYHVLLCPDRLDVSNYGPASDNFRVLKYSKLAVLVKEASDEISSDHARAIMLQYADFITHTLGQSVPSTLKLASARTIARRNKCADHWSEDAYMKQVSDTGDAEFAECQAELLDLLRSMVAVEPRFGAKGSTNATYKVYLADTDLHVLWVYANGRLYVTWKPLREAGLAEAVDFWKRQWGKLINATNVNDAFVQHDTAGTPLSGMGVLEIAAKLQHLGDYIQEQSD